MSPWAAGMKGPLGEEMLRAKKDTPPGVHFVQPTGQKCLRLTTQTATPRDTLTDQGRPVLPRVVPLLPGVPAGRSCRRDSFLRVTNRPGIDMLALCS